MTSFRQLEANRCNALKSTGPATREGKQRSRRNAVRHGLTAETVIGTLEDAEDYKAFEAAIAANYDAESAVERELVLRLASLLWRLRRASAMETGLFGIEAEQLRRRPHLQPEPGRVVYAVFGQTDQTEPSSARTQSGESGSPDPKLVHTADPEPSDPAIHLAHCFLGLANLPSHPVDRLSRYEARLWRQAGQILFALNVLIGAKPRDRARRFNASRWACLARRAARRPTALAAGQ
jgi:hypothetical protein